MQKLCPTEIRELGKSLWISKDSVLPQGQEKNKGKGYRKDQKQIIIRLSIILNFFHHIIYTACSIEKKMI